MNIFLIVSLVIAGILILLMVFVVFFRRRIAVEKLKHDAEKGDTSSQLALVGYYFSMEPKDIERGMHWLVKAAEMGSPDAQTLLGTIYGDGRLIPQNKEESLKWFLAGAMGGNPLAQKTVAGVYHFSVGLDKKTAYAWYRTAALTGDNHAIEMAEKLMNEFNEADKKAALELANIHMKKYAPKSEGKKR